MPGKMDCRAAERATEIRAVNKWGASGLAIHPGRRGDGLGLLERVQRVFPVDTGYAALCHAVMPGLPTLPDTGASRVCSC